jgi:DNA-binding XRE family transcriptional regulator
MDTHVGQHQGRLVAQYRAYLHMSQQDLADAMHLSLRTVQRMEQEPMIKDPFRRRLLVALPGIPAAALGLDQAQQKIAKSFLIFNDDPMSFLEETVANCWKIHLMGGPLSAAHGLDRVVREVETFAYKMRGKEWHHGCRRSSV